MDRNLASFLRRFRIRRMPQEAAALPLYPADPVEFAVEHLGYSPDPIQQEILRSSQRELLLCMGRRTGKTFSVSTRALHSALLKPNSETLVFSRSQRQANIVLGTIQHFLRRLGIRPRGDGLNKFSVRLPNYSRIFCLPPKLDTSVGFTPSQIILDEAARIPDGLYQFGIRPMLSLNKPTLIALSTPNGRAGFFYREWNATKSKWQRFFQPSTECPRIDQEFLAEERANQPDHYFRQEFLCEFLDASEAFFPEALLDAAIDRTLEPFTKSNLNAYPQGTKERSLIVAVDLGYSVDPTAICVMEVLKVCSLERNPFDNTFPESMQYRIRHMERLPLKTSYHSIVDHVVSLIKSFSQGIGIHRTELVLDATSNRPVVEMFRNAKPPSSIVPVTITGGDIESSNGDMYRVPKRDLMNGLHIALEDNSIRIPAQLSELDALREEFRNFKMRYTDKGNDTYSSESPHHDDLLITLALATWRT